MMSINEICAKLVVSNTQRLCNNNDGGTGVQSPTVAAAPLKFERTNDTPSPLERGVRARTAPNDVTDSDGPPVKKPSIEVDVEHVDDDVKMADDDDCSLKSWGDNQMHFLLPHLRAASALDAPPPATTPPEVAAYVQQPSQQHAHRARQRRRIGGRSEIQRVSGFLRFLTHDDCASELPADKMPCAHRRKRAHYHCMQARCNRAYLLASEAHMHYNTHCKVDLLARDGFARYKANEQCPYTTCPFRRSVGGQLRATHFHCLRTTCNFSFKNKSDMEKHKSSHEREAELLRDGFRKIYKTQKCPTLGCAQSRLSTHMHCVRRGCHHVLISTSQMVAHKRRHERDDEHAVRPAATTIAMPTLHSMSTSAIESTTVAAAPLVTTTACAATVMPQLSTTTAPQLLRMSQLYALPPPQTTHPSLTNQHASLTNQHAAPPTVLDNSDGLLSMLSSSSGSSHASRMSTLLPSLPAALLLQLMGKTTTPPTLPYVLFDATTTAACAASGCVHATASSHYHCAVAHCHYSTTDRRQVLNHADMFHSIVDMVPSTDVYDKTYACNVAGCALSLLRSHMHCTLCRASFNAVNAAIAHKCASPTPNALDLSVGAGTAAATPKLPYTIETQCARPFCKLKRLSIHYHCRLCGQGFSNVARLLPHLQKCGACKASGMPMFVKRFVEQTSVEQATKPPATPAVGYSTS